MDEAGDTPCELAHLASAQELGASLAEAMPPACSFLPCLGENQPKSEHKQKQQEAGRLVRSLCL